MKEKRRINIMKSEKGIGGEKRKREKMNKRRHNGKTKGEKKQETEKNK